MEEKEKVYSQGEGAMRNANELSETMLYPISKTKEEVEEMINTRIKKDLNIERLNHMIKENKSLEGLMQRYARVRNSWGKADSVVKVIGSVIILLMGISIILLPAIGGIVAIPLAIIESILGGTATLTGFTSVMISMRWTKRKKKEFHAGIKLIVINLIIICRK